MFLSFRGSCKLTEKIAVYKNCLLIIESNMLIFQSFNVNSSDINVIIS